MTRGSRSRSSLTAWLVGATAGWVARHAGGTSYRRRTLCCRSITDYLLLEDLSMGEVGRCPRRAVADRAKVPGLSLPKTGVFADMVGDFWRFAPGSANWECVDGFECAKPAVSGPVARFVGSTTKHRNCLPGRLHFAPSWPGLAPTVPVFPI